MAYIQIELIKVGDNFSREQLTDIESLMHSLEQHDQIQPIVLDYDNNLVAGFRRLEAAKRLGWTKIKYELTDKDPRLINFIENLERQDLTFYEQCVAIRELYPGYTDQEVADALGKTVGWSRPRNQLFTLPDEVVEMAKAGNLSPTQVSVLLTASDQTEALDKLLNRTTPGATDRFRPGKKHFQKMMTVALERGLHEVAQTLRYVIGDIDEEELWDEVGKD